MGGTIPFHLDWHKDARGYVFTDQPKSWSDIHPNSLRRRPYITRKGGRLQPYRPLDIPHLYRKLANYDQTDDGALALATNFGFLFAGSEWSEHAELIINAIDGLRELLALADDRNWPAMQAFLDEGVTGAGGFAVGIGALTVEFAAPLTAARPTIRLHPASLLEAAVVQLMRDVAFGPLVRPCVRPGCGKVFEYGPGTGRRETARYCSKQCKDAHLYMKRKEAQR